MSVLKKIPRRVPSYSWSPMYAPENCVLLTLERSLSTGPAAVSATWTFAADATRVWNSLPPDMRKPELSYGQFRLSLKTFLFGQ